MGVALALVAGCGGGGDRIGSDGGRLAGALAGVSAPAGNPGLVAWSDLDAIREAGGSGVGDRGDAVARWLRPFTISLERLGLVYGELEEQSGFDVTSADQALTVGESPEEATRLVGDELDVDALRRWLEEQGAEEDSVEGEDVLRLADDGDIDAGPPPVVGRLDQLNVVSAEAGRVVAGPTGSAVVALVDGGDEPLGDEPGVAVEDGEPLEVLCAVGAEGDGGALAARVREILGSNERLTSRDRAGDLLVLRGVTSGRGVTSRGRLPPRWTTGRSAPLSSWCAGTSETTGSASGTCPSRSLRCAW